MEGTRERKGWSYYTRPDEPPQIAITKRDLSVLFALFENRFMNTTQLRAMFGGSIGGNFDQRIKLLFRAGYIARPRATRIWRMRDGGGSNPGIYTLTNRGAQALVAFGIIERNVRDWDELNRELTGLSSKIPHDLDVGNVRVAFQRACLTRPELRIAPATELAHAQHARALQIPGYDEPLYPDWTFALIEEASDASLYFLELHRGTEPLMRFGSPDLSHLKGKYERYLAYALAKQHVAQFGVNGFRVLTVITGGERMLDNVIETAASVTGDQGVNRFLAARLEDLLETDPLKLEWRNAAGDPVRLL
jgi:hypothetical protein